MNLELLMNSVAVLGMLLIALSSMRRKPQTFTEVREMVEYMLEDCPYGETEQGFARWQRERGEQ